MFAQSTNHKFTNKQINIGGLILAGGKASRMNGVNKGLQKLHGRYLVQHLIDKFKNTLNYLAISANSDVDKYQQLGLPVFSDLKGYQNLGPIGGIYSACINFPANLDAIVVMPCDTPFLPLNLIGDFYCTLQQQKQHMVFATTTENMHPSIFMFKPHINQHLKTHIACGDLSLKSWLKRGNACAVLFDDEQKFININTLHQLQQLNQLPIKDTKYA